MSFWFNRLNFRAVSMTEEQMTQFHALAQTGDTPALVAFLQGHHPADIAACLDQASPEEAIRTFHLLEKATAAEVLTEVQQHLREDLLEDLEVEHITELVEELAADDAADIVGELDEHDRPKVLAGSSEDTRQDIQNLLKYPEDTAGGLMDTFVVKLPRNLTLGKAAEWVRGLAEEEKENIPHNVYVVDASGRLEGRLPLRNFILHHPDTRLEDVMETKVRSIDVAADQEHVAAIFRKYNYEQMPVVDAEGRLLGRILVDDVVDVIDEEHEEDMYRLAGLSTEETLADDTLSSVRRRLPWLIINLGMAAISARVVASFEHTISQAALLAAFMPIVAGLGGNAGTQSIALVVRATAMGTLNRQSALRALKREAGVGVLVGVSVGLAMGLFAWLVVGKPWFGLVVGTALMLNVAMATVLGTAIPMLLKKWGKDPAVASSVFVTPLTDSSGFFIFLTLATVFMAKIKGG